MWATRSHPSTRKSCSLADATGADLPHHPGVRGHTDPPIRLDPPTPGAAAAADGETEVILTVGRPTVEGDVCDLHVAQCFETVGLGPQSLGTLPWSGPVGLDNANERWITGPVGRSQSSAQHAFGIV